MTATRSVDDALELTYKNAIDGTSLDPTAFDTLPDHIVGAVIQQLGPNTLNLILESDAPAATTVVYTGSTPGVLTPQSVLIT